MQVLYQLPNKVGKLNASVKVKTYTELHRLALAFGGPRGEVRGKAIFDPYPQRH